MAVAKRNHRAPGDPGQDVAAQRARQDKLVSNDEKTGAAALGNVTLVVNHQGFVGTGVVSRFFSQDLPEQVYRLDIASRPANIGGTGEGDPRLAGLVFAGCFHLREHEHGRPDVIRPDEIAFSRASRHLHVYEALIEPIQLDQLPKRLQDFRLTER